jgi:hypothetical protein
LAQVALKYETGGSLSVDGPAGTTLEHRIIAISREGSKHLPGPQDDEKGGDAP